jgi:phosphatidylglycerophosphatase A
MAQTTNEIEIKKPEIGFFTKLLGSGFMTGYAPYATGTVASAAALLLFLIPGFELPAVIIPATIVLFVLGGRAADSMEQHFGQDPSVVTIDEIVGMLISLWFIEPTLLNIGLAFLIFRILDILKPYPAQIFDSRKGGWNIMLDDVVAGVYTNIIIQISLRWF